MLATLMTVCVVAVLLGVGVGIAQYRKVQWKERDDSPGAAAVKNPVMSNPALIAIVLFPVVAFIGALLVMYYMK